MSDRPIAFVLGSDSDLPTLDAAFEVLKKLEVRFCVRVLSAHRTPEEAAAFARQARDDGVEVLIGVAGLAAHLAGALAAHSPLPVLGVPVETGPMRGEDALLSTAMMPPGTPVAAMGIGRAAATNAALFAVRVLALADESLRERLDRYRAAEREKSLAKDRKVREQFGC